MTKHSCFLVALCAFAGVNVASADHHASTEMFEKMDTDKDGVVTLQEVQTSAAEHFDEADTNKDGKVSPEERKAMHDKWVREHFEEHDKNKDGKLERSEVADMPEAAFKRLDKNKDGVLTLDEKIAMGPEHCQKGQAEAERKGDMTKDKLMTKVDKKFTKIDTNKDGKVTEKEFTTYSKAKMAKHHHECPEED